MRQIYAPDDDWDSWTLWVAAIGLISGLLLSWVSETFWWIG